MLVKEYLKSQDREIIHTTADTNIAEAMGLLIDNSISCLPVLSNNGEIEGIVSDKDIFKLVYEHRADFNKYSVRDIMTTDLLIGLPGDDLTYLAGMMYKNWVRHIPIVEGKRLAGLISQSDVVKVQMGKIEVENRYLRIYFKDNYPG